MLPSARPAPTTLLGALVVAGAIGLFVLGLDKSIWLDEHLSIALASREDFLAALRDSDKPPLYFVLLRLWMQLGTSDTFLRVLSVLASLATLLVLFCWLAEISQAAALLGGLLFSALPLVLRYAQEIRNYSLLLLLTTASFALAARLARQPRSTRCAAALGLTLTAAVATHLIAAFLVPSVVLYAIAMRLLGGDAARPIVDRRLMAVAIGPLLAFLGFYLCFLERLPTVDDWWMPALSWGQVAATGSRLLGIDVVGEALAEAWPGASDRLLLWPLAGLWVTAALSLLPLGNWRSGLPALLAALAYWLQLGAFSLLVTPILGYRTALPGIVPFLAFLAIQATTVRVRALRLAMLGMGLGYAGLCAWTWASWKVWQPYEPWKELAAVLEADWRPGDLIVVHPAYAFGPLRHYLPDEMTRAAVAAPLPRERGGAGDPAEELLQGGLPVSGGAHAYLVVRHDANVRRAPDVTAELDTVLWQRVGERVWERRSGGLAVAKYGARTSPGPPDG